MSIRVMSVIWERFPGNGSELLCMLALADFANDTGIAYPAMATLAKKIRLSRRQTQKVVRILEKDGWVSIIENARGGNPNATPRYRINLNRLTHVTDDTGELHDTGELEDADPCHGGRRPVSPATPKPSLTVKNRQAAPTGAPNVWDLGKSMLTSTGLTQSQAGSFLGKIIKEHGEIAVSNALAAASLKRPADLRSWLQGTLRATAKKQASSDIYTPAKKAVGAA